MKTRIEEYTDRVLNDDPSKIRGYVVAIVGKVRSSYLTSKGETTYKEGSAHVLPSRAAGAAFMRSQLAGSELWKFAQLVPLQHGKRLPTGGGY